MGTHLTIGVVALPKCFRLGCRRIGRVIQRAEGVVHASPWRRCLRLGSGPCLFGIANRCAIGCGRWWCRTVGGGYLSGGSGKGIGLLLVLFAKQEGHGVNLGVGAS